MFFSGAFILSHIIAIPLFICLLLSSCDDGPTTLPGEEIFENLDRVIESIREEFNFAGVSVAVVRDDRLVYSNAYGYSDRENSIPAETTNLFRIASVSKLITAVTVFRLIEEKVITLDDRVFGDNSILNSDFGTPGQYVDQITVRHLLEYGSGFIDGGTGTTQADRIRSRVTADLNDPPGTFYSYKNIDYLILGRIIEKVTDSVSYEKYVQDNILSLCGINSMAIGGNERKPDEVKYYTPQGTLPITSLAMNDSSGGWIATATDLAKLLVRINRNQVKPDILSSTYSTYTPTQAARSVSNIPPFAYNQWFYFGDMAGTRAVMRKIDERTGYVVLINTSIIGDNNFRYYGRLSLIEDALTSIRRWSPYDLFQE